MKAEDLLGITKGGTTEEKLALLRLALMYLGAALDDAKVSQALEGADIKNIIVVPGKLINFVTA